MFILKVDHYSTSPLWWAKTIPEPYGYDKARQKVVFLVNDMTIRVGYGTYACEAPRWQSNGPAGSGYAGCNLTIPSQSIPGPQQPFPKVYLCNTETYVDMGRAAGFEVVSTELVHSQGRFPSRDKSYNRESRLRFLHVLTLHKIAWKSNTSTCSRGKITPSHVSDFLFI